MTLNDNSTTTNPLSATNFMPKAMLTLTPAAIARLHVIIGQKSPQPEAVLISVTTKGCSGMSYDLQYLDKLSDAPKYADIVKEQGVAIVIDPKATMYIVGSVMDYQETPTHSGFEFTNPNETGRCGCGESFTVK